MSDTYAAEVVIPGNVSWSPIDSNGAEVVNAIPATIVVEVYEKGEKGDKGADGESPLFADKSFVHTQSVPLAVWVVAHNLNKIPSVEVLDSTGDKVYGDVRHTDNNNTTLTFAGAFSGTAHFN